MIVIILLIASLCAAAPASAQMTPLTDDRHIEANVTYQGMSDHQAGDPPGFFAGWIGAFVTANVNGTVAGSSDAGAFQNSLFFPAGLQFDGGASGSWQVVPGEHYDALSHVRFKAHANQCLEYTLYTQVEPGTIAGSAWAEIRGPGGRLYYNEGGVIDTTGRIVSGDYTFEGRSSVSTSAEQVEGGTYSLQWTVTTCASTPIGQGPRDTTVACNQAAAFCVVPNGPIGSFTYQWRRNYVALANSAHYAGVTTNCLTIQHACFADVADYDCLVTASSVTTPSSLAHLAITPGPVGVEPAPGVFALGVPVPNPSFASTSLRYEAPRPFFARVTIHDAAGRVVRRLPPRLLEASGMLTWDGRSDSGTPAVPGVYFLRLETGEGTLVRRLARVR
jgi:hypothetical protein